MKGETKGYTDFMHPTEVLWSIPSQNFYTICRIVESKSDETTTVAEYLTPTNETSRVKVDTPKIADLTFKLGSKIG